MPWILVIKINSIQLLRFLSNLFTFSLAFMMMLFLFMLLLKSSQIFSTITMSLLHQWVMLDLLCFNSILWIYFIWLLLRRWYIVNLNVDFRLWRIHLAWVDLLWGLLFMVFHFFVWQWNRNRYCELWFH